jgi:uncharacterized phage-associated protein
MVTQKEMHNKILPSDIAKYFLLRSENDGELISPLKMQKLVYYAYAWYLVTTKHKLFDEQIEAWANGPVIPSLYRELKKYGAMPINAEEYANSTSQVAVDDLITKLTPQTRKILDDVYEQYQTMTAFELVVLTHQEKPWAEARKGLFPEETANRPIADQHIFEQYVIPL